MATAEEVRGTPAIEVSFSMGKMTLSLGQEFTLSNGTMWRIDGLKDGRRIYSPSGSGGTPTVMATYIGGTAISEESRQHLEDDKLALCADSVALAIYEQQRAT